MLNNNLSIIKNHVSRITLAVLVVAASLVIPLAPAQASTGSIIKCFVPAINGDSRITTVVWDCPMGRDYLLDLYSGNYTRSWDGMCANQAHRVHPTYSALTIMNLCR
jgi:hypothetical protein